MTLSTKARRWTWFCSWLVVMFLGLAMGGIAVHWALLGKMWFLPVLPCSILLAVMIEQYCQIQRLCLLPWDPTCPVARRDELVHRLYRSDDRTRHQVLNMLLQLDKPMYCAIKKRMERASRGKA